MAIDVEIPEPLEDGFDHPTVIPDVLYAFPGHLERLLPPWDEIPDDFKNVRNPWLRFVSLWFRKGWPEEPKLYEHPNVPGEMAFRHAHTIMKSFEPSHEHKVAGVAWLLSRWFFMDPKGAESL